MGCVVSCLGTLPNACMHISFLRILRVTGGKNKAWARLGYSADTWAEGRVLSHCHGSLPRPDLHRGGKGVYRNGFLSTVGAQISLTCPLTQHLPPSLPDRAQFFKDHSGCSVVSAGRAEGTEGTETGTQARRNLQYPRSVVEVARARVVRGGMLGRARECAR